MPLTSAGELTIEKSPGYFINADAPARVAAFNPYMKLIVVLRDPVERAVSGAYPSKTQYEIKIRFCRLHAVLIKATPSRSARALLRAHGGRLRKLHAR